MLLNCVGRRNRVRAALSVWRRTEPTRMPRVIDAVLVAIVAYHLYLAPYTKVEELFNIQAIHDIVNYGAFPQEVITAHYDHVAFPGAVPRLFVGALVISGFTKMIMNVSKWFGHPLVVDGATEADLLLVVRSVLGLANAMGIVAIGHAIDKVTPKKRGIGWWYTLLACGQFHLLYYALRTLPNFVALPVVNFALAKLIQGDISGLSWLAFCGVVFRLEISVFATIIAIVSSLIFRQTQLSVAIVMLMAGTVFGLFISILFDLYFWGRLVWPELEGFVFNVVHGKSVEWGTEPWKAYFTRYLWQLFRPPLVLLLVLPGLVTDPVGEIKSSPKNQKQPETTITHPSKNILRILTVSSIIYVAVMSFQPHKEWRFIIYTVPIFIASAANAMNNVWSKRRDSISTLILAAGLSLVAVASIFVGLLFGYFSSYNYPGGEALYQTNKWLDQHYLNSLALVHMDVALCMTGINRFGEIHRLDDTIIYDKTEDDDVLEEIWDSIDILISEKQPDVNEGWQHVYTARKFSGVSLVPTKALVEALRLDPVNYGKGLLTLVVDEVKRGQWETAQLWLQQSVKTEEYLYVFERTRHPDDDN